MTITDTRQSDGDSRRDDAPASRMSRPAPPPLGAAKAGYVAAILALALTGIGVVGVRDAAVHVGWLAGTPWLAGLLNDVGEVAPQTWMTPAGVGVAVLGLALVVVACLPRRSTAVAVSADSAVYLRIGDVGRVASAAAADVPGVLSATSSASSRRVTVRCRVTDDGDGVRALVTDAVGAALQPLQHIPRITVRVTQERDS